MVARSGFMFYLLSVFSCVFQFTNGLRYPEPPYYPVNYYDGQSQYEKIKAALGKLEHAPELTPSWPDPLVSLGQVSGVAMDNSGRVLVFHRASNVWDENTFTDRNVYKGIGEPAISHPTILVFNDTGELDDSWGQNLFYMPHGITVDIQGNVWVTDVALHQVFKFTPENKIKPALVLGEKFIPADDRIHFCKPSAVAVLPNGDFFVADGYCNARIIKFSADGERIMHFGRRFGESVYSFSVPHALTLAPERGLVCVADREHGRVGCFHADNGTYAAGFSSWLIGGRLFSVAYAPVMGGRLYVVNGPGTGVPVRGYVIDFDSGRLVQTFAPDSDFHNPHDLVTSPDGSRVYVAELNPYKVYRFADDRMLNETVEKNTVANVTVHSKPTITLAVDPIPDWRSWMAVVGGMAAALGAALLIVAMLAWLRSRNRGRKSAPRRRWEYGGGEFKLRRLLARRRFTRVRSDDSDDEPAPMLPPPTA